MSEQLGMRHVGKSPPPPPRGAIHKDACLCANPNCGFHGVPVRKGKGSRLALVILVLITLGAFSVNIIAGVVSLLVLIVYWATQAGYKLYCARCNTLIPR
jgi:hypothetical protein